MQLHHLLSRARRAILITLTLTLLISASGGAGAVTQTSPPVADPQVDPTGHCDGPKIAAGAPEANDLDGDGLYEDVNGDNTVDIFDVQTILGAVDTPCQANLELFNFDQITPVDLSQWDAYSHYLDYVWTGF
jgi:hypothetical protein